MVGIQGRKCWSPTRTIVQSRSEDATAALMGVFGDRGAQHYTASACESLSLTVPSLA
jgi:hypothetical protein